MIVNNMLFRRISFVILSILLILVLSSCGEKTESSSDEILTQKATGEGKIPVTVLVKYAFTINGFEKAAEEKFPNLDIIQVGNYTSDRGLVEYDRRLKHDDLTDIVMTWPLNIGEEYWDDRLIDLSGMPFTGNYNTGMLNNISKDGKLYYLPGPSQIRGIVYNKTLFKEKGWKVPKDYNGFVDLCKEIESSGIRSLQLGFENPEVLDTSFIGYSYGNCFSTPKDSQWIENYNEGKGRFDEHFSPALDIFQDMIDAKIWQMSDLNISYADRENMLFNRKCAMVEDSVLLARMGKGYNGNTDEFALMPFFSPGQDNDWARLYMVCYIGLNKHLEASENKDKYELVKDLMAYISTPDGQQALSSDTGAMYSSVKGVPLPDIPEIKDLENALNHGRYAIFPESKNIQPKLRECLTGILKGTMTKKQASKAIDRENKSPSPKAEDTVIGEASSDFTLIETGNFITDIMRGRAHSDIALFMDNGKDGKYNGKGVSGAIYKGKQTEADAIRIFPDLKHEEKGTIQIATMTGKDLIKTLEYSIPVDNNNTGWFYYFSGLRMEFDPIAKPGKRIKSITDGDGNQIDMKKTYSVAVMDKTIPEDAVQSLKDTKISIKELISDTIKEKGEISPSNDGRFVISTK